jgi:signal transduction histidine kinase
MPSHTYNDTHGHENGDRPRQSSAVRVWLGGTGRVRRLRRAFAGDSHVQRALEREAAIGVRRRALANAASAVDEAIVTIRDDGPGIPHSIRERIFDPFFESAASSLASEAAR